MKNLYVALLLLCPVALWAQCLTTSQTQALVRTLTGEHWRSIDSVKIISSVRDNQGVSVTFTPAATTALIDKATIDAMQDSVQKWCNAKATFIAGGKKLQTFIPKHYTFKAHNEKPVVTREGLDCVALSGRNIALWNSHGRYYNQSLERWQWQRARLFTTVEDLLSGGFVVEFLAQMLENSGATIFLPRERDIQPKIYIADNSDAQNFTSTRKRSSTSAGFTHKKVLSGYDNPFAMGTADNFVLTASDSLTYTLHDVEPGHYALYVCYNQSADNSDCVTYSVKHHFGRTQYAVNQRVGGAMWIFLGNHYFDGDAQIIVKGEGKISADAVRLGGGVGVVERGGTTSNVPRYAEAARYYLQADGFNASVYTLSEGKNDYTDDVNCRGEWVNALKDKGIDIDLALAVHTDAGVAEGDTTIGTLTIVKDSGTLSDGRPRRISRDWAHAIERQIARDIRATWDSAWTIRGIWDKGYSEARRADCPNVLLEILSHQNLNDVQLALHPQFRFDVCRAIYKAIARFICGENVDIQPLSVSHFGIELVGADSLYLSWKPTTDPLEPKAEATHFLVYANNQLLCSTTSNSVVIRQRADNQAVEYYVVACNNGGVSFPSMSLCASISSDVNAPKSLFVNGFTRVAAPKVIRTNNFAGVVESDDSGTAWRYETLRCGQQYDFCPTHPWTDDDAPGWGASYANDEMIASKGSHTSTREVVERIAKQGYTVISQEKTYFEQSDVNFSKSVIYDRYDISLGAQRIAWYGQMKPQHVVYTDAFIRRLSELKDVAKQINIAGFYVGTELDDASNAFAIKTLGFAPMTDNASKSGVVVGRKIRIELPNDPKIGHPDAIVPACKGAKTFLRYDDSGASAAVEFENVRTYGFWSEEIF